MKESKSKGYPPLLTTTRISKEHTHTFVLHRYSHTPDVCMHTHTACTKIHVQHTHTLRTHAHMHTTHAHTHTTHAHTHYARTHTLRTHMHTHTHTLSYLNTPHLLWMVGRFRNSFKNSVRFLVYFKFIRKRIPK